MDYSRRLQKVLPALSTKQKRIAEFIAEDGTSVSFASLKELAVTIDVSESSIVRFAQELGYKGYPDLRQQLQAEVKAKLSAAERMRRTISNVQSSESAIPRLFQKDVELIEDTVRMLAPEVFAEAVDLIWRCERVFIIGLRSSFSLAYFIYFRLIRLQIDARLITITGSGSLFEKLALMREKDLLIAIGFDNVPDETIAAVARAREVGARVLGVTHLQTTEIGQNADITLVARRDTQGMVESLTAPFSLLNALAISVATARKARSLAALTELDRLNQNYARQPRKPRE